MTPVVDGFLIGLVGSLHCAGMCGPIVLAMPLSNKSNSYRIFGGLLYNLGRAITYAILGALLGFLGQGIRLAGLQQWVSIVLGMLMIISVIMPGVLRIVPNFQQAGHRIVNPLKKKLGKLLQNNRIFPMLGIGLINGLLPCGLVYAALSGSLTTSTYLDSILFMFLFGLGTLPLMFTLVYFSSIIKARFFKQIRSFIPVFMVILGLLFILRGMNLGWPYISPKISSSGTEVNCNCHNMGK